MVVGENYGGCIAFKDELDDFPRVDGCLGEGAAKEFDAVHYAVLGIEEQDDVYMASVEFSGMIREDDATSPSPFREVWNMTKPTNGRGGWLVAGVQALQ